MLHTPRKSATAPTPFFQGNTADFFRHDGATQQQEVPLPEVTGWQSVPLTDLAPKDTAVTKARSNSLQKPVAA